jgi:hypothetical protein
MAHQLTDHRDRAEVRELLGAAQGYAVLGRDRKRVGVFIELEDEDGGRIAVRKDGVFFWRRDLLPLENVAEVVPERRLVLLDDEHPGAAEEDADDERAPVDHDWRGRIESYVSSGDTEPDRHLRFVSTPSGYVLMEAEGRAPSPGSTVALPEELGPFLVLRLGPSPLPNDRRTCAYLAPH